jgi:hypothetical protein
LLLVATAVVACRRSPTPGGRLRATPDSDSAAFASFFRTARDSADSVLRTPPLITAASVVVFWLKQGDTLDVDQASEASDDMRYYTQQVAPTLKANDIQLLATNAETVYVALPNHKRRPIILSGLDYPYGYLFLDPGNPERILTGVYDDEDLLDELDAYFDLTETKDSTPAAPHVTT